MYDTLVAMVRDPDSSVRTKGQERLARVIKKTILKGELAQDESTVDIFCLGHFVNSTAASCRGRKLTPLILIYLGSQRHTEEMT